MRPHELRRGAGQDFETFGHDMERDAGAGGQRRDRRASVSADSSGRTGERVPDGGGVDLGLPSA